MLQLLMSLYFARRRRLQEVKAETRQVFIYAQMIESKTSVTNSLAPPCWEYKLKEDPLQALADNKCTAYTLDCADFN